MVASYAIFLTLLSLQLCAIKRKMWIAAILLPSGVVLAILVNHYFFQTAELVFLDYWSGTLPAYFLGAGVTALIMAMSKDKQSKV